MVSRLHEQRKHVISYNNDQLELELNLHLQNKLIKSMK